MILAKETAGQLFLVHQQELLAWLTRKLRDRELAADLTQETFLRIAELGERKDSAPIRNSRSYLFRTANNLAIDHARQRKREAPIYMEDGLAETLVDTRCSPEENAISRNNLVWLNSRLSTLPERTASVFRMSRVDGLTYREIAQRLGISDSSVQKHLSRALTLLRQDQDFLS